MRISAHRPEEARRRRRAPRSPARGRRSATGPTTSRSPASAPGGRRSRSSTVPTTGRCRSPRPTCPVVLPRDLVATGEGNPLAERPDFVDVDCPRCGTPAKRETDTLDCHFDALFLWVPATLPPEDRATQMFTHPESQKWLPAERLVAGGDSGGFVFDQRIVTKALRDHGEFAYMTDGEPFEGCLFHEMVIADGRKMSQAPRQRRRPGRAGRAVRRRHGPRRGALGGGAGEDAELVRRRDPLRQQVPAQLLDLRPRPLRRARGRQARSGEGGGDREAAGEAAQLVRERAGSGSPTTPPTCRCTSRSAT